MDLMYLVLYIFKIKKVDKLIKENSFEKVIENTTSNLSELKKYDENEISKLEKKIIKELIAIDKASTLFWGEAKCLHRTILQYDLLRKKYGLDVEIVIGVKKFPFASHAWLQWSDNGKSVCELDENIIGYQVIYSSKM